MTNRSHSSNFAVYLRYFPHALDMVGMSGIVGGRRWKGELKARTLRAGCRHAVQSPLLSELPASQESERLARPSLPSLSSEEEAGAVPAYVQRCPSRPYCSSRAALFLPPPSSALHRGRHCDLSPRLCECGCRVEGRIE
jgi:hypothetical protein